MHFASFYNKIKLRSPPYCCAVLLDPYPFISKLFVLLFFIQTIMDIRQRQIMSSPQLLKLSLFHTQRHTHHHIHTVIKCRSVVSTRPISNIISVNLYMWQKWRDRIASNDEKNLFFIRTLEFKCFLFISVDVVTDCPQ